MSQGRRHFTDEFKREAVALLVSVGQPLSRIASELGISASMLLRWCRAAMGCEDRRNRPGCRRRSSGVRAEPFSSLIPSQRPTQLLRQGDHRSRNGVAHGLGTMPGECGSVFHASLVAMVRHARQVQQQGEARHTLHQGANCGTAKAQDEVPFPVARDGAISCLRRALADHDFGSDEGLAPPARARSRHPQHPPGTQAGRQLAAQRATILNEQSLIDGFMADVHGLIVREVDRQAASNLLRAPGVCPPSILPRSTDA
jgi:hypothetical protein